MKTIVTIHFDEEGRVFIDLNGKPAGEEIYIRILTRLDDSMNEIEPSLLDLLKSIAE